MLDRLLHASRAVRTSAAIAFAALFASACFAAGSAGAAAFERGDMIVTHAGPSGQDIIRIQPDGTQSVLFTGAAARAATFDPISGDVFVGTYQTVHRLDRITGSLTPIATIETTTTAGLQRMEVDAQGNLYTLTSVNNDQWIHRIDPNTGVATPLYTHDTFNPRGAAPLPQRGFVGMQIDANGKLLLGSSTGQLFQESAFSNDFGFLSSIATQVTGVDDILLRPDGDVYASIHTGNCAVSCFSVMDWDVSAGAATEIMQLGSKYIEDLEYALDGTLLGLWGGSATFLSQVLELDVPAGTFQPIADISGYTRSSLVVVGPIPEPGTALLLGLGLLLMGSRSRRVR